MPTLLRGKHCLRGLGIAWILCIGFGLRIVLNYDNAAGAAAVAPQSWPENLPIARAGGKFTLVLLAHPDCPCSYASLSEVEAIRSHAPERVAIDIVFSRPGARAEELQAASLWKKAATIPGAALIADAGGMLTLRFGGKTSGQTLLYSPDGALLFSGGITASRGHEGDCAGVDAIDRALDGESIGFIRTPVFGCSLYDPQTDFTKELRP